MNRNVRASASLVTVPGGLLPWWYRGLLIALATLILCSCTAAPRGPGWLQTTARQEPPRDPFRLAETDSQSPEPEAVAVAVSPLEEPQPTPASQSSGGQIQLVGHRVPVADHRHSPPAPPVPLMVTPHPTGWPGRMHQRVVPPVRGHAPWPDVETIHDGGDGHYPTQVRPDFSLDGLEPGDTIGHFDTLDGQVVVQPSNRVPIYAPRFASVRAVVDLKQRLHVAQAAGVQRQLGTQMRRRTQPVWSSTQDYQAVAGVGTRSLEQFRRTQYPGRVSQRLLPHTAGGKLLPFEDLGIIQRGEFIQAEKARLAFGVQAAASWSHDKAVQVFLGNQQANAVAGDRKLQTTYQVKTPKGTARLRVVKIADKQAARPGEEIHFTIRFDNVGTQVIGNVTIVDNLVGRLEYVKGSAQCSLKADFFTQQNEVGSLVLRWEIIDPLQPGQGGVIHFRCRVR